MDNPYQPPKAPPRAVEWDYDRRPEDRRPTALTVLAIFNIVFSAFTLICVPVNIVLLVVPLPGMPGNPALRVMQDPTYRMVAAALYGFGLLKAVVELSSGIGLLRMKRWGRTLALAYVSLDIFSVGAWSVFNWVYVIPAMKAAGPNAGPQAAGVAIGGMIGGTIGPFLGLIYPIVLLVFMLTPSVVQAFERGPGDEVDLTPMRPL